MACPGGSLTARLGQHGRGTAETGLTGCFTHRHLPEIIGDETVIMHEFSQQVKKVLDSMKD